MTVRAKMKLAAMAVLLGSATSGAAAAQEPLDREAIERMIAGESQAQGAELERRIAAADAHPLGARENPVRAAMPQGQRAYLRRLRCSNGQAPQFRRVGNFGIGVYGNIIDAFELRCAAGAPATIYMDMYHPGHVEERPISGFTILPERSGAQRVTG